LGGLTHDDAANRRVAVGDRVSGGEKRRLSIARVKAGRSDFTRAKKLRTWVVRTHVRKEAASAEPRTGTAP
jgi:hypothetical protein